jgi:hypothetical protein
MTTKEKGRWQAARVSAIASDDSSKRQPYSLRNAINEKCRECIHDPAAPGTWREQVAQCSVPRCALWPVRPAPSGGPFANPPRDPATVTRQWLANPVGYVESGYPLQIVDRIGGDA